MLLHKTWSGIGNRWLVFDVNMPIRFYFKLLLLSLLFYYHRSIQSSPHQHPTEIFFTLKNKRQKKGRHTPLVQSWPSLLRKKKTPIINFKKIKYVLLNIYNLPRLKKPKFAKTSKFKVDYYNSTCISKYF